jgi:hypothetical protein
MKSDLGWGSGQEADHSEDGDLEPVTTSRPGQAVKVINPALQMLKSVKTSSLPLGLPYPRLFPVLSQFVKM